MSADFWDNPDAKDDTPVIRHAPDQHSYHVPDAAQLAHMRGSKVGRFALIPAANRDGTSKGFDPTVAGPVHVDPDAPDGGVVFDPRRVREEDVTRAVATSQYPHQAFYKLGVSAPQLGIGTRKQAVVAAAAYEPPPPPAAHVSTGFGAPPATYFAGYNPSPAQEALAVSPVPQLPGLPPLPQAQPAPAPAPAPPAAQYQPAPQYYAPPPAYQPPQLDPNIQALMSSMVALQQTVGGLVRQVQQPAAPPHQPPTTGLSPVPLPVGVPQLRTTPYGEKTAAPNERDFEDDARPIRKRVRRNSEGDIVEEQPDPPRRSMVVREEDEQPQRLRDYQQAGAPPEGVIAGFETLNLKFVTGPIAQKAKKQVYFEIPGAGRHLARFHDVIDAESCVVLVYDTRYEEGQQYVPPELPAETTIGITVGKGGKDHKGQTYRVASLGLNFAFGVFDMIVMVKQEGADAAHRPGDDD